MAVIGITGSISSGKTTASKFISINNGPLFSADQIVNKLYKTISFKKIIFKKFKIKSTSKLKLELKKKIFKDNKNLLKLAKIIHPLVRKKMLIFLRKNRDKQESFVKLLNTRIQIFI